MPRYKTCSLCGKRKTTKEFYKLKKGHSAWCKECAREYSRTHYHEHREKHVRASRRYHATIMGHLHRVAAGAHRRATEYSVTSTVEAQELYDRLVEVQSRCAYCGRQLSLKKNSRELEFDHVVPMSRGGANQIENIAPSCHRCNAEKADWLLEEWTDRWYQ